MEVKKKPWKYYFNSTLASIKVTKSMEADQHLWKVVAVLIERGWLLELQLVEVGGNANSESKFTSRSTFLFYGKYVALRAHLDGEH